MSRNQLHRTAGACWGLKEQICQPSLGETYGMWLIYCSHIIVGTKKDREHIKGNRNICVTVFLAIKGYTFVTMS